MWPSVLVDAVATKYGRKTRPGEELSGADERELGRRGSRDDLSRGYARITNDQNEYPGASRCRRHRLPLFGGSDGCLIMCDRDGRW